MPPDDDSTLEKGRILSVKDSALTLVRCDNMVFLAIIRILGIHIGFVNEQTVSANLVYVRATLQS
jgi:hypothetical protein